MDHAADPGQVNRIVAETSGTFACCAARGRIGVGRHNGLAQVHWPSSANTSAMLLTVMVAARAAGASLRPRASVVNSVAMSNRPGFLVVAVSGIAYLGIMI